jgi:hypothetical protein
MEQIIVTIINWSGSMLLFYAFAKEYKKYIINEENKINNTKEENKTQLEELEMKNLKNYNAIKKIIKRLPFKGEPWEQEFVVEELNELEKTWNFELGKPLVDENEPITNTINQF